MRKLFLILAGIQLFGGLLPAWSATYYVAPNGLDTNPGTLDKPWANLSRAMSNCVAGDITLVQPGIYITPGKVGSWSQNNGTSNAPIIFRANGPVTNKFPFALRNSWIIIDGFTFTDLNTDNTACWFAREARYCVFTNNTVKNMRGQGPYFDTPRDLPAGAAPPETCAQYCLIISNRFDTLTNGTMVTLSGVGHRVQGNVFANGYSTDALRPFGSNHVITGNVFTNIFELDSLPTHPDIIQLFGSSGGWGRGMWGTRITFERNLIINCPVQLLQLEQNGVTNNCDLIIQNNLFVSSDMQTSISFEGVKFWNNTFYRCNLGHMSLMNFLWYNPAFPETRGQSYRGEVRNNALVECSMEGFNYGTITITWDANGREQLYVWEPTPPIDTVMDYNYVCWTDYSKKTKFSEPHGINGGNPSFTSVANSDFRLQPGSILAGKGTPIPGVQVDFLGKVRPNPPSIDAFEVYGAPPGPTGQQPPPPSGLRLVP